MPKIAEKQTKIETGRTFIVASAVKEFIKGGEMQSDAEFIGHANIILQRILTTAMNRAKANGRKRVYGFDL